MGLWTEINKLVDWWCKPCENLCQIVAKCLQDRSCQHYFINNCNLIDNSFNMTNIRDQLMSIDDTWLSRWFVDNYIRACLQLSVCPRNISRLFDDVTTRVKLQNAVSALVAWRRNSSALNLWIAFNAVEFQITKQLYIHPLSARSCVRWMTEFTKIDSCLSVYFTAVAFLHVASRGRMQNTVVS